MHVYLRGETAMFANDGDEDPAVCAYYSRSKNFIFLRIKEIGFSDSLLILASLLFVLVNLKNNALSSAESKE